MAGPISNLANTVLGKDLSGIPEEELAALAEQYPFFAPAHFLRLMKVRENSNADDANYQRSILYYHAPFEFDHFLNAALATSGGDRLADDEDLLIATEVLEKNGLELYAGNEIEEVLDQDPVHADTLPEEQPGTSPEWKEPNAGDHVREAVPVQTEAAIEVNGEEQPDVSLSAEAGRDRVEEEVSPVTVSNVPEGDAFDLSETRAELNHEGPVAPANASPGQSLQEYDRSQETPVGEAHLPPLHTDNHLSSAATTEADTPDKTGRPGTPEQGPILSALTFEPFHTVDYFASQGIKVPQEPAAGDTFGKQVKSFTDWLKTMKRLTPTERAAKVSPAAEGVANLAAHSVEDADVVTESMAEVWVKQGNPDKAKEVYTKLSLQNPSKSAYFAAKIHHLTHSD